jgi:hypothetical protein
VASGRRLAVLVVALALVGAPAVALRAFCVGKSCTQEGIGAGAAVPFCPLPAALREQIVAGFRQGRSPDVMAATPPGLGLAEDDGVPWPQVPYAPSRNAVPIIFFGHGIIAGRLPDGIGVNRIAPTLAALIGFDRPHPQVRSGTMLPGAVRAGAGPPLVVEIVWKGVGSGPFTHVRTPWVTTLRRQGAWTMDATTGSLPVDPAAVLTTIGTGGLPSQHGITGTLVRDAQGTAVRAWSAQAPTSIIATLPDDWDHATAQRARIGLLAGDEVDRGLIGGTWYLDNDRDDLVIGPGDPLSGVTRLLGTGYGADGTTDILGVVMHGPMRRMDRQAGAIVAEVRRQVPDAAFVLTTTGAAYGALGRSPDVAMSVNRAVGSPVVAASVSGGLFLDRAAMTASGVTSDAVVRAMEAMTSPPFGESVFADAYPGFAVGFSRYC